MKKMYIYVYIKQSRRKELTTIKRFGLSIEGVTLILTVKNHQLGLRKQRRPGFQACMIQNLRCARICHSIHLISRPDKVYLLLSCKGGIVFNFVEIELIIVKQSAELPFKCNTLPDWPSMDQSKIKKIFNILVCRGILGNQYGGLVANINNN